MLGNKLISILLIVLLVAWQSSALALTCFEECKSKSVKMESMDGHQGHDETQGVPDQEPPECTDCCALNCASLCSNGSALAAPSFESIDAEVPGARSPDMIDMTAAGFKRSRYRPPILSSSDPVF